MSFELPSLRRRTRIVEHIIFGFKTANEAIVFANTVESLINEKVGKEIKFNQFIGSTDTELAITPDWMDDTVLKTRFLDVEDQNTATFICEQMVDIASSHEQVHKTILDIRSTVVREKPQEQTISAMVIPKTSSVKNIG